MAHFDPKTGKITPTWTVRFTAWQTLLGSAIAGVVCAIVLAFEFVTGPGIAGLGETNSVLQGLVLLVGGSLILFLILGPSLAWGLGFGLRNIKNQNWHVIAFGVLGILVGGAIGGALAPWVGVVDFGSVLAPAAGIGAAVGRWVLSPYARI